MQFEEIGVAYRKNEKQVWRYAFQQYVVQFLRLRAEMLRLKLSGKKKQGHKCIESRNAKNYPEKLKNK